MHENQETIQVYNEHFEEYIDATPKEVVGDVKEWIDKSLALLPQGASVLELGSGFGRDADYIESKGFSVARTEASESFVEFMRQHGHEARLMNAITDEYGGPYDMVFADAVLLHFTPEETQQVLKKAHATLKPNGVLSIRVKEGEGAEWDNGALGGTPRFYYYWRQDELRELLERSGFAIHAFDVGHSKFNKFSWLQVVAKKVS